MGGESEKIAFHLLKGSVLTHQSARKLRNSFEPDLKSSLVDFEWFKIKQNLLNALAFEQFSLKLFFEPEMSTDCKAKLDDTKETLMRAIWAGDTKTCARLLLSCNPNEVIGDSALCLASESGQKKICALLLDHGATHVPDKWGDTPLIHAASNGHREVCELLLDRGATHSTDERGTALCMAAAHGHKDVCELLLTRGASHATTALRGQTPLIWAASQGHKEVCELLLDRGATHAQTSTGDTPLFSAAYKGDKKVCELLLDRGATHAPNKFGVTPLYIAAKNGHVGACRLLLDRGATHDPDEDGNTPLSCAASQGHKDVCALLLDCGATHTPNKSGLTPLSAAAATLADHTARVVRAAEKDCAAEAREARGAEEVTEAVCAMAFAVRAADDAARAAHGIGRAAARRAFKKCARSVSDSDCDPPAKQPRV